jgi:hypothetical protein
MSIKVSAATAASLFLIHIYLAVALHADGTTQEFFSAKNSLELATFALSALSERT